MAVPKCSGQPDEQVAFESFRRARTVFLPHVWGLRMPPLTRCPPVSSWDQRLSHQLLPWSWVPPTRLVMTPGSGPRMLGSALGTRYFT